MIENAMSIDVEDYFHVAALSKNVSTSEWDNMASRVEQNTQKLLRVFEKYNVKATFFVLGWVAERYPQLVFNIDRMGHEVASHGYSHQLIYTQSPDVFQKETCMSKTILEDIIGKPVLGYRAASYSITNSSLWALDIIAKAGFKYDSSIFPVRHDKYGIPGFKREPHVILTPERLKLIEFPLSTFSIFGQIVPIAGGGYFRLYPYWLSKYFYTKTNKLNKSFVFYMHPWEIDPEQPRIRTSLLSKFRHYNNLEKCQERLQMLLNDFSFIPVRELLAKENLLS